MLFFKSDLKRLWHAFEGWAYAKTESFAQMELEHELFTTNGKSWETKSWNGKQTTVGPFPAGWQLPTPKVSAFSWISNWKTPRQGGT